MPSRKWHPEHERALNRGPSPSRASVLASDALPPSCTLTLSRRGRPELDFGVAFTPAQLQLMGSYMEFATHLEAVELHEPWKMKRFFSVRKTKAPS